MTRIATMSSMMTVAVRNTRSSTGTLCLAHLIRDVKFLTTLPDPRDRAYGEALREALRELFAVIHRRERLSPAAFQGQLEAARAEVLRRGTSDVPATRHGRN